MYVKPSGNDNNTGSSWTLAKKTVQAGLNAAGTGDQVWVAAGTYYELITLKTGVGLYGGFAGLDNETLSQRNWRVNISILDGQQNGSVVTSPEGADNTTRIDGFTICNGAGTVYNYDLCGGGIYCLSSAPTIANNTIIENYADYGGGIYSSSNTTIINNTISGNSATSGGGICCTNSTPAIANNTVGGNDAYWGGGIYCYQSSPSISNNTVSGNTAYFDGGGVYCSFSSSSTIINNSIIVNTAGSNGSGIYCRSSSPVIANNVVAFNGKGIFKLSTSDTIVLRNNCFFNATYNYSGLPAGQTDIQQDPLLVNVAGDDFHLTANSPCIDQGNDADVQNGWLDMDGLARVAGPYVDMGAYEYPSTATGDCDRDGQVTALDLSIVVNNMDKAAGSAGFVGKADLDGDGEVTSSDLTIVLAHMP